MYRKLLFYLPHSKINIRHVLMISTQVLQTICLAAKGPATIAARWRWCTRRCIIANFRPNASSHCFGVKREIIQLSKSYRCL